MMTNILVCQSSVPPRVIHVHVHATQMLHNLAQIIMIDYVVDKQMNPQNHSILVKLFQCS